MMGQKKVFNFLFYIASTFLFCPFSAFAAFEPTDVLVAADGANQPTHIDALPDLVVGTQRDSQIGCSVAIHGDISAVGAPFFDIDSDDPLVLDDLDAGAICIFERTGTTWNAVSKAIMDAPTSGDWPSSSAAVYENTIVVGARL
jgi:hypothetical protein